MARVPYADRATLDLRKIAEYCLNPAHPRGRHKARVFREALGLTRSDARWLGDTLLAGLQHYDGIELERDALGSRWRVDISVVRHDEQIVVRTIWIIRSDERAPRFVTCWVL